MSQTCCHVLPQTLARHETAAPEPREASCSMSVLPQRQRMLLVLTKSPTRWSRASTAAPRQASIGSIVAGPSAPDCRPRTGPGLGPAAAARMAGIGSALL